MTVAASPKASAGSLDLLTERAYQALLAQLRDGRLKSGAFMSIAMLVDQLGLPIASVREAVKRAEATALVTVLPKRGVMVMEASATMTRDCLGLRAMFDCEGARLVIETGGQVPLAALRTAHEQLRDEAAKGAASDLAGRAIRTDLSLHDALASALGSDLSRRLYDENRNRIAVIQNSRPFLADRIVSAMTEHLAIIAAIEARDTAAAHAAIRAHLHQTLRWWGVEP